MTRCCVYLRSKLSKFLSDVLAEPARFYFWRFLRGLERVSWPINNMAFLRQWPMRVNLRNADAFVPEGPDDGSQAWNAWNVPSRSPSRRVRYDRLVRGGFRLACWTNLVATDHTVPYGTDQVWPLPAPKAFGAGYPRFVPPGQAIFLRCDADDPPPRKRSSESFRTRRYGNTRNRRGSRQPL
jgi:hypothetical protein